MQACEAVDFFERGLFRTLEGGARGGPTLGDQKLTPILGPGNVSALCAENGGTPPQGLPTRPTPPPAPFPLCFVTLRTEYRRAVCTTERPRRSPHTSARCRTLRTFRRRNNNQMDSNGQHVCGVAEPMGQWALQKIQQTPQRWKMH